MICAEHASGVSGGGAVRCWSGGGQSRGVFGAGGKHIPKWVRVRAKYRRSTVAQRSSLASAFVVRHACGFGTRAPRGGRAGERGRTFGVGDDRDQGISSRFVGSPGWRARSGPWSLEGATPRAADPASVSVEMSRGAGPRSISLSTSTPPEEVSTRAASPRPSRSSAAVRLRVSMSTRPSAGVAAVRDSRHATSAGPSRKR